MSTRGIVGAIGLVAAVLVGAVVFLWPAPATGPEPIEYGRDTCAGCRMPLSQPGYGGEMRDHEGTLAKYDDIGCLLRAIITAHREVPATWVEDHDGAGLVPLLTAHLVHAEGTHTPMGYGIVAFKDETAAARYAAAHAGRIVTLEDVLHSPTMLAGPPRDSST